MSKLVTFLVLIFCIVPFNQAESLSDTDILRRADIATGAYVGGLRWHIDMTSTDNNGRVEGQTLEVKTADDNWVAETLTPLRARGQKLLMIGRNMWFTKPNLRKPVPISIRQRLAGGASNGDVASTNYARDYEPTRLNDDVIDGYTCYVFDLTATEKVVTYDKVKYWIRQDKNLGIKAEFYSRSGKLLKAASFSYENIIDVNGNMLPFISEMTIEDKLTGAMTKFNYSEIVVEEIPASTFRF